MVINFIGNYAGSYTSEKADEDHLSYEMEAVGHVVRKIPRDEWREHVINGQSYPNIPNDLVADINIVAKWNGFDNGKYIQYLRDVSHAPVFYWVWDYMQGEPWHMEMVKAADLYIANDVFSGHYRGLKNCYYFPFDVSSRDFDSVPSEQIRDVAFFGSWIPQGDRQEWLQEINKHIPVDIFSWNYQDWPSEFTAHPAVYGKDFALEVAKTKICLGFSVHPNTWGYWSNRTGKILSCGGFLLYQYAPGMELLLREGVVYFSSPQEAVEKIKYYLENEHERNLIASLGYIQGRDRFTSYERVKDLMILVERFLKKGNTVWNL